MRKIYTFLCSIAILVSINGQSKLNFGLTTPQDPTTLPKSKALVEKPVRKQKSEVKSILRNVSIGEYVIADGWELQEANAVLASGASPFDPNLDTKNWYNATVPGTVLTTLVEQGEYPDPYYGLNNLFIPDSLCRTSWWYRTSFELPTNQIANNCRLLFNGINYRADVWLNGKLLGRINGAFVRGQFNVSDIVKKDGKNILAVQIFPPNNPGIPHESYKASFGPNGGQLCLDGPTFISSEGWDWIPGIRDRNIGLWQDVRLLMGNDVSIVNPQITTSLPLPDTTVANITIHAGLKNTGIAAQTIELTGKIENITFSKTVTIAPKENTDVVFDASTVEKLRLTNPRLWWPNGYGKPNLYTLELNLSKEGKVYETKLIRFGIREFSYELMVDAPDKKGWRIEYSPIKSAQKGIPFFDYAKRRQHEVYGGAEIASIREGVELSNFKEIEQNNNPFLVIKVNGKRIFCKGGNWGMDDGMKRVSRERLEPYLKLHKLENFNMIRNWTAESTEEVFYDLCDEYGMLVWNDFSMSTENYNLNPIDYRLFAANVKEILLRYRNHASIAIWCPRNEGYAPTGLEDDIQNIIASNDGTRHYHGNSRNMNMPWSGPWHYFKNPSEYYKVAQGFNSELGTLSVPTAETMRKFISKKDLWPISDAWYYHDLEYESHEWKAYLADIDKLGIMPAENVDEFCNRAQIINFQSHREMFEAWNHKMWNFNSGMLLWMSHPAWPSVIWQTYSYDYETHGSFYGSKKACEPLHIQWNTNDNAVIAVNASLQEIKNAQISFTVYSKSGNKLYNLTEKADIAANGITNIFVGNVPTTANGLVMARLTMKDAAGKLLSVNDYWIHKQNRYDLGALVALKTTTLNASNIVITKSETSTTISASIKNPSLEIASSIKLNIADGYTGESILPVYASDGYFNLLPGETTDVKFEVPNEKVLPNMQIVAEGFNTKRAKLADVK